MFGISPVKSLENEHSEMPHSFLTFFFFFFNYAGSCKKSEKSVLLERVWSNSEGSRTAEGN